MRRQDTLDKRYDTRAVEDVELRRVFLEDLREGELLDGASSVVGRVEGYVCRGCVVLLRCLDG